MGTPLSEQTVDLSGTSREDGDAERRPQDMCDPAAEPVGPTVLLDVDGGEATWTADGRRSYSGWDDHDIASWELDLGDGTEVGGGDVLGASVTHTYGEPGEYDITLTVTDDTGRSASATGTVTVPGDPSDDLAPTPDGGGDDAGTALPATGAGLGVGVLLLAAGTAIGARGRRPGGW